MKKVYEVEVEQSGYFRKVVTYQVEADNVEEATDTWRLGREIDEVLVKEDVQDYYVMRVDEDTEPY